MLAAGNHDEAVKKIEDHLRTNRNEVRALAGKVETLWAVGRKEDAAKAFEELRSQSSTIDMDVPVFKRLSAIAVEMGLPADWKQERKLPDDLGARPELAALGPFRWQPVQAPAWSLPGVDGQAIASSSYQGKPVVVIFYLGFGCLHCAEQLQKFAPAAEEFRKAGIELVAISTDRQELLSRAYEDLEQGFPFPLVADPELNVFRKYRCFDDFEQQPLHGTFLVDGQGRIRWQDISYEPFMDPEFVLKEAQRLLGQDRSGSADDSATLTQAGSPAARE
jgi:peroxiredoxin